MRLSSQAIALASCWRMICEAHFARRQRVACFGLAQPSTPRHRSSMVSQARASWLGHVRLDGSGFHTLVVESCLHAGGGFTTRGGRFTWPVRRAQSACFLEFTSCAAAINFCAIPGPSASYRCLLGGSGPGEQWSHRNARHQTCRARGQFRSGCTYSRMICNYI